MFEETFMLISQLERTNKFPDSLYPSKNGVLTIERMLPEEDFKGSLVLMLLCLIVSQRASELVEIVEEQIYVVA